jgi:hypothetical protein
VPARKPPERLRGDDLFRSLTHPKTLAFVGVSVAVTALVLGCAREPGEPEFPTPWNADDLAGGQCIQTCQPDFGSSPVDCAREEAGLEFFPAPVWDFETAEVRMDRIPGSLKALQLYTYTDNTSDFLVSHDCSRMVPDAYCDPNGYEPNTYPAERCGPTHVLRVRGGPFREWGGGMGRRLAGHAADAADLLDGIDNGTPTCSGDDAPAFCPEAEPSIDEAPGRPLPSGPPQPLSRLNYYEMIVDLREWEGISFWARRGPDSQPGIRVALGDRNTDDDTSFLMSEGGLTPRCHRTKECGCRNHRPCTRWNLASVCWDPTRDPEPVQFPDGTINYPLCGNYACDEEYPAFGRDDLIFTTPDQDDPNYAGTNTCAPYTFANDITRESCYDPVSGPLPPESTERCGDPWMAPVRLNTDWTFYRIPFTELRQEGYGKEFPALDLAGVTMVRFTWTVGWIDYWIDDVRFYRHKT